jgi:23S rRNA pseudouridine1911/1915/1917 synthase
MQESKGIISTIIDVAHEGMRLDVFWSSMLEDQGISRSRIQKWIKQGRAVVDRVPCTKPNTRLEAGQHVGLEPIVVQEGALPCVGELSIVYRDEDILVIDKPTGLTVHPAPSVQGPTLVNILVHHFPEIGRMDPERPGIVHRLDKDTSGLMLVALNEPTRLALVNAFADRQIDKEYLAVVHGVPDPVEGEIDCPIGRHPTFKTRMAVLDKGGLPARSSYKVVWSSPDGAYCLVRVRIYTGRTHQVRVHMTHIGHPLVGDSLYRSGQKSLSVNAPLMDRVISRQMLHAWRLGFAHPTTRKRCAFILPPPNDMMRALVLANTKPCHVGLTGMSGSGKSTVLAAFARMGVPVWSADRCVLRLYGPGADGWELLRGRFGDRFVHDVQAPVDKKRLFQAMCIDPSLRREIEEMIHPMVLWDLGRFLEEHRDARMTVSEVPLLMESGWQSRGMFDYILGVFCPEELRRSFLADRNWSEDTLAVMDSWQWSQKDKLRGCDLIISNDTDKATLERQVARAARLLRSFRRKRMHALWARMNRLFRDDVFEKASS